jgi:hypothetical protein
VERLVLVVDDERLAARFEALNDRCGAGRVDAPRGDILGPGVAAAELTSGEELPP